MKTWILGALFLIFTVVEFSQADANTSAAARILLGLLAGVGLGLLKRGLRAISPSAKPLPDPSSSPAPRP